jgi:hypothetical protein
MTTDTITLEKQSVIAERLVSIARPLKVRIGEKVIEINPITDWDLDENGEAMYTEKNRQAHQQAMQELANGETIHLDLKKVKTYEDFMKVIKAE